MDNRGVGRPRIARSAAAGLALCLALSAPGCREGTQPPSQQPAATPPRDTGPPSPRPSNSPAATEAPIADAPGCALESIQATVRQRLEAVTACYRDAALAEPTLAGRVVIELGIERGGVLKRRAVQETTLPEPVGACIVRALDGLSFPGTFDTPCIIQYPFVFSASVPRGGPE